MSADYITIKKKRSKIVDDDNDGHDFPSMSMNLLQQVNIKVAIFIFIFGLLIFSDIFVKTILMTFSKNFRNKKSFINEKFTIFSM